MVDHQQYQNQNKKRMGIKQKLGTFSDQTGNHGGRMKCPLK